MAKRTGKRRSGEARIAWAAGPGPGALLMAVYRRLYECFGPQHWWPADSRFEMIVGAILTQSSAWVNVERALGPLKEAGALDPAVLRGMPECHLAQLIYSSGYYNAKARKIKAFVEHLGRHYADDLDDMFSQEVSGLRSELLSIHGIGEETADSILLYAGNKPVFVIDAYTRRVVGRVGQVQDNSSYSEFQRLLMDNLPRDTALFNEYHALIVALGKNVCRKKPLCHECCLSSVCAYGRLRVQTVDRKSPV